MREIKFRAWDKKKKHMAKRFYQPTLHNEWDIFNYSKFINSWKADEYILMQYTGLKDKNGKEIYEGDIIHIQSEYNDGRIYDNGKWEVYWRNDRWHLQRNGEGFDNGDYYQGDECPWPDVDNWKPNKEGGRMEIIGNVFENPELMEGK